MYHCGHEPPKVVCQSNHFYYTRTTRGTHKMCDNTRRPIAMSVKAQMLNKLRRKRLPRSKPLLSPCILSIGCQEALLASRIGNHDAQICWFLQHFRELSHRNGSSKKKWKKKAPIVCKNAVDFFCLLYAACAKCTFPTRGPWTPARDYIIYLHNVQIGQVFLN